METKLDVILQKSDILWTEALQRMEQKLSIPSYNTWLKNTTVHSVDEDKDTLVIGAENEFARDWLVLRYAGLISETLFNINGKRYQLHFEVHTEPKQDVIDQQTGKISEYHTEAMKPLDQIATKAGGNPMDELVTYGDYLKMPDDGNRYEIVNGTLQMMGPAPSVKHQQVLRQLTLSFGQHCTRAGEFFFAPIDVIFDDKNVRQPDFVFIANEHLDIVTEKGIEGSPDLLVEILSTSTAKKDKADKREMYERFGVKEYWILDPFYEVLEQFVLATGQYMLHHVYKPSETVTSPQISCIAFSLNEIFDSSK